MYCIPKKKNETFFQLLLKITTTILKKMSCSAYNFSPNYNVLERDYSNVCKRTCPIRLTCHTLSLAIARRHSSCFKAILKEMEKTLGPDAYQIHAILSPSLFDYNKNPFCLEIETRHRNTIPLFFHVFSERATDNKESFQGEIGEMIKFLAFNGVDINQKVFGETLFHYSIRFGHFFLAEIAMELHADPFIKNIHGIPMDLIDKLPKSYNPMVNEKREKMRENLQDYMDMYLYDVKTPDI